MTAAFPLPTRSTSAGAALLTAQIVLILATLLAIAS